MSIQTKHRDLFLGLALFCAGAALLLYPTQSMQAGQQGLQLCFNTIIPSLFPFFVLSSLAVELGLTRYLGRAVEGLMWPLFRVNGTGACALVLGLVGGYPVGAQTAITLYEKGLCSKAETQRMLAFCNNSGPAFLLGVVGAGVFGSSAIGLLLYLAHAAAAVCVGILFRFYGSNTPQVPSPASAPQFQSVRLSTAFTASVKHSFASVWNICAFVVFFTVVIRLLSLCGIMELTADLLSPALIRSGLAPTTIRPLLTGLLEVSSGVASLSAEGALPDRIVTAAFLLGWAGLCVHCQVLSLLSGTNLSPIPYLIGKGLHASLSALFALGLIRLFPTFIPVSGSLLQPSQAIAPWSTRCALTISAAAAGLLWTFFLCFCIRVASRKKSGGKPHQHRL